MLYLDTSALLKLYLPEAETAEVAGWVRGQDRPIPFSSLHELELASVMERRSASGDLSREAVRRVQRTIEADLRQGVLQRPELDWPAVFSTAISVVRRRGGPMGLRALDSLHLAAARQLQPEHFVTYDRVQSRAASLEGLKVRP